MVKIIGVHMTIDGTVRRMPTKAEIAALLKGMPAVINTHILDGPHIVKGDVNNPGWTGFVIIDTSHISIHTFDREQKVSFDVFSCKPFDKDKALSYVTGRIAFVPETMSVKFIERSARKRKTLKKSKE